MNERIRNLAEKAGILITDVGAFHNHERGWGAYQLKEQHMEKFAEVIVQDYASKTIQGLMSDPAFVQAMDEYYEQKWAHRFG